MKNISPAALASTCHAGGTLASYDPAANSEVEYGRLPQGSLGGFNCLIGMASTNRTAFKTLVVQGINRSTATASASEVKKYSFVFGRTGSLAELTTHLTLN